jgi:hypothetical protein
MDYGPRALQLTVTNDSGEPITITRAAYISPRFVGSTEWSRPTRVEAGARVNLRILLGAPACDGDLTGSIELDYTLDDGRRGSTTLAPTDEIDTLASVAAQDCLAERVAAIADIHMADSITTEMHQDRLIGLIGVTATPTGADGSVSLSTISRTILLRPENAATTAWTVGWAIDAKSAVLSTTLAFEPSNCNPHIVAEDKRGTFFPLEVALDNGLAGTVSVGVSDEVKSAIYAYIGQYCGW